MKRLILFLLISSIIPILSAQGLNANASYIKKNYPVDYSNTLKKHALEKWKDNYEMVVYEINQQSDALFNLIREFKTENSSILFKAIEKWGYDGYKSQNLEKYKNINIINLKNFLTLNCNWEMVKYEYDNQVKAKNAF